MKKNRDPSPPLCPGIRKRYSVLKEGTRRFLASICRSVDITALDSKVALQMQLMQQTDDALFLISAETGRILQANEAASSSLGYSAEELHRLRVMDIVVAIPDAAAWGRLVVDFKKRGKVFKSGRCRRKDGSTFPVEVTTRLIERGGKGFVVVCARDITERKLSETALRNERVKLGKVLSDSPVGIALYKSSGDCLMANNMFAEMVGADKEKIIAQNFRRMESWKASGLLEEADEVFGGASKRQREIHTVSPSGEDVWLEAFLSPVSLEGERCLLLMINDISDRKKAEETRDLLTAAVEQAAESIIITDEKARIEYVNPAFERLTGFSADEVINKTPKILKSGKHQSIFYEAMWKTLSAGKVWHGVLINKKKDGTLYHEDTTIAPIRNGAASHYVAIKRDVTEQMELRDRMAHTEKLASAGMIASGVAHEINNPLSTILGLAHLLYEDGNLKGDLRTDILTIIKQARRAGRITQGMLEFSRNKKPFKSNVDLREVVEQTLLLLKHDLQRARIKLEVKLPAEPAPVHADADQLQQVLINLLVNAKHAMEKKEKKKLRIFMSENDERIFLEIQDSGCGFSPKIAGRIFDPFFTTKPVGQGTGLGLAICYGIAVEHGGIITATSEEGEGSSFILELPARRPAASRVEKILSAT